MFHKVKMVNPLSDYSLLVQFENEEKKQYNIKHLLNEQEAFKMLMYIPGLFEQVKVDAGGYGISWNDEIDLACDELYYNGTTQ
ncbi:MAG: DUF2442 domain-containing protein [Treponema sp.]|nr:DUF2442 domain-containing protein [Treponema sp.]